LAGLAATAELAEAGRTVILVDQEPERFRNAGCCQGRPNNVSYLLTRRACRRPQSCRLVTISACFDVEENGAGDGDRTRDFNLGKVVPLI
jgi:hypothetical protein